MWRHIVSPDMALSGRLGYVCAICKRHEPYLGTNMARSAEEPYEPYVLHQLT